MQKDVTGCPLARFGVYAILTFPILNSLGAVC
jgi:hypothetical protein